MWNSINISEKETTKMTINYLLNVKIISYRLQKAFV